jgi:adenylylsulfate kinase-like enzyme
MVIVITGPIASGKSTVARELMRELERGGVLADVIDLDRVYEALAGDGPKSDAATWGLARHEAAIRANAFLAQRVATVIAEGSFNAPEDRLAFVRHLSAGEAPLFVTLRVGFDEALRRAQADPTRGLSRDPEFLGRYFDAFDRRTPAPEKGDLAIDTEKTTAAEAAITIANHVGRPDRSGDAGSAY